MPISYVSSKMGKSLRWAHIANCWPPTGCIQNFTTHIIRKTGIETVLHLKNKFNMSIAQCQWWKLSNFLFWIVGFQFLSSIFTFLCTHTEKTFAWMIDEGYQNKWIIFKYRFTQICVSNVFRRQNVNENPWTTRKKFGVCVCVWTLSDF